MLFGVGSQFNELHASLACERLQFYMFCHFSLNKIGDDDIDESAGEKSLKTG